MNKRRYFIHLAYMGTRYRGWQRQANIPSVQQAIEDTLSQIYAEKVIIHGCGRTDAGVHASQYFAHVDLPERSHNLEIINRNLPGDIAIYDIIAVPEKANAQLHAKSREYTYSMHTRKHAAWSQHSALYYIDELDLASMQRALDFCKEHKDFRSLCKSPDLYDHTICHIFHIEQDYNRAKHTYTLRIKANRFLRSMIRYLMGRLIDIGRGEMSVAQFEKTLLSKQAFEAPYNYQAHPQGLYLSAVTYDNMEVEAVPIWEI